MKILFITSGSIGDAIISSGILNHLLEKHPDARFTLAGGVAAVSVFEAFPNLDRIIKVKKQTYNRHWLSLWQQVRREKWDIAVDLRGSLLTYCIWAKKRYIFWPPDKSKSKSSQIAAMMRLEASPPTRLWSSEISKENAKKLLPEGKNIIVFAPKSASFIKDWAIGRFAELAQRLCRQNTLFVVLATQAQKISVQALVQAVPAENMLDLSGQTDLLTAYAVLERAQLFIGNDSGLFHMAAAAGIKCIGLYGPTNDKIYAPSGAHVRIVKSHDFAMHERGNEDNAYMQLISVDTVEEMAVAMG